MKLTETWLHLVSKPSGSRSNRIKQGFEKIDLNADQRDLAYYLINSGCSKSLERVKEFLSGNLLLGNFASVEYTFPIDWAADPHQSRSWQWLHHQLAILGDFANLITQGEHDFLTDSAQLLIEDWTEKNFTPNNPSEFSWGDHSTAHRLKNLVNFFLASNAKLSIEIENKYLALIDVHCRVLSSKKFYNKHTNHGLDQVLYLLVAACFCPQLKSAERYKKIAVARLEEEIKHGFADDGVHVENSPQYHFILLNRLAILNSLIDSFNLKTKLDLKELFRKAIIFAKHIKRPDGCIPIIGDSEQKIAFLSPLFSSFEEYKDFRNDTDYNDIESHFFEQTGYYTYRKKLTDSREEDLHFVLKSGYLSNYHRQDDDGSFVLNAYGEDWFVDGGLYKHDNKDPIRSYLRGVKAHNTVYIEGAKINRRVVQGANERKVKVYKTTGGKQCVKATICMYPGYEVTRNIELDSGCIVIIDEVLKQSADHIGFKPSFLSLFHVPCDKQIKFSGNKAIISSSSSEHSIIIEYDDKETTEFSLLKHDDNEGVTSKQNSQLEKIQTIVIQSKHTKCSYSIKFLG